MKELTSVQNGPRSLESPVAGQAPVEQAQSAPVPTTQITMPPMEIQAGPEPTPAPAQGAPAPAQPEGQLTPEEQADLIEAKQTGGLTPEEQADLIEAQQANAEKQGPPEPTGASIGRFGYFRSPEGKLLFREPGNGDFREPTPGQRQAAGTLADALETIPELAASFGGAAAGKAMLGIAGRIVGSGAGFTGGGELADYVPLIRDLREVATGKATEPTTNAQRIARFATGAGGEAAGAVGETLAQRAAMKPAAQTISEQYQALRKQVGPALSESEAKQTSFKDFYDKLANSYKSDIADLKAKAYLASKDERFPVLDFVEKIKQDLLNRGVIDPSGQIKQSAPSEARQLIAVLRDVQKQSGAQGGLGLTLKQMDQAVTDLQNVAGNAYKPLTKPNPVESVARSASGQLRELGNDSAEKVFARVGDDTSAAELRAARAKFAQNWDGIQEFQKRLVENPTDALKELVRPNEPSTVATAWRTLDEPHRQILSGRFVDSLLQDESGNIVSGAAQVRKNLQKYDPKIRDTVLGELREPLEKLVNYATALEKLSPESVSFGTLVKKSGQILIHPHYTMLREGGKLIDELYAHTGKARQELLQELFRAYPAEMSARQGVGVGILKGAQSAAPAAKALAIPGVQNLGDLIRSQPQGGQSAIQR